MIDLGSFYVLFSWLLLFSSTSAYILERSSSPFVTGLRSYCLNAAAVNVIREINKQPDGKTYVVNNGTAVNRGSNIYNNSQRSNVDVTTYFSELPIQQHTVNTFFDNKLLLQCTKYDITTLFRLLGKKCRYQTNSFLKPYLPAIVLQLNTITTYFTYKDISTIIYGLQLLDWKDEGVMDIISFINDKEIGKGAEYIKSPKSQDISMLLYGLQRIGCNNQETKVLLQKVYFMIDKCNEVFKSQEISNSLYGLQGMNSKDSIVLSIVSALIPKVRNCNEMLSAQSVSNSIYGLMGMDSKHDEIRSMLAALLPKAKGCTEEFIAQGVSNIFYGFQSMSSEHSAVRNMLKALIPKVSSCKNSFNAQQLGNFFYGLQNMNSKHTEVSNTLTALIPIINSCTEDVRSQEFSNVLYSLRSMSSEHPQIRNVLLALLPKLRSCEDQLSTQSIGNALLGLQCMSSEHSEVRQILSVLASKINSCNENCLRPQEVGNALYGIQSMSTEFPEVRDILKALAPKIKNCNEIDGQGIGNAVYGLAQGVRNKGESFGLFEILNHQLNNLAASTSNFQTMSHMDLVLLTQNIVMVLPKLRDILEDDYKEWDKMKSILVNELERRRTENDDVFFILGNVKSTAEQRVLKVVREAFSNISMSISANEYLFNLFESDIVLRIPLSQHNIIIIDIEVNGIHHERERSKRFCMLRDKYLKSQEVVVERIEASTLRKMEDEDVKDWLHKTVTSVKASYSDLVIK